LGCYSLIIELGHLIGSFGEHIFIILYYNRIIELFFVVPQFHFGSKIHPLAQTGHEPPTLSRVGKKDFRDL